MRDLAPGDVVAHPAVEGLTPAARTTSASSVSSLNPKVRILTSRQERSAGASARCRRAAGRSRAGLPVPTASVEANDATSTWGQLYGPMHLSVHLLRHRAVLAHRLQKVASPAVRA